MRTWDKTKDLDITDDRAIIAAINEAVKLRIALRDKWINGERLVAFIDKNRDGRVDYNEFYDGLSHFGITESLDVDLVFAYMMNHCRHCRSSSLRNFNSHEDSTETPNGNGNENGNENANGNGQSSSSGVSASVPVSTMLETLNFSESEEGQEKDKDKDQEKKKKGNDDDSGDGKQQQQQQQQMENQGRYDLVHASTTLDGKKASTLTLTPTPVKKDVDDGEPSLSGFPKTLLVGIVAHDNLKNSMLNFVLNNIDFFNKVRLITAAGCTGDALASIGLDVDTLVVPKPNNKSGPTTSSSSPSSSSSSAGGGDDSNNMSDLIIRGEVAAVFFFTDPLSLHPHEADITALNRICCVHDTMFANNPSSAQCLVYSLEHSAFGFSRLTGQHRSYQRTDSMIVEDYRHRINEGIWTREKVARRGSEGSSTITSKLTDVSLSSSTKNEEDDSDVHVTLWNEHEENTPVGNERSPNRSCSDNREYGKGQPTKASRFLNFSNYRRGNVSNNGEQ